MRQGFAGLLSAVVFVGALTATSPALSAQRYYVIQRTVDGKCKIIDKLPLKAGWWVQQGPDGDYKKASKNLKGYLKSKTCKGTFE